MRHGLLRLSILVLAVAPVSAQTPRVDLTGTWQDPSRRIFEIHQSGKLLTLDLKNGIVLKGELSGRSMDLSFRWTVESATAHLKSEKEEGPQAAADRAAAIKALAGTVVSVKGTVSANDDFIDLIYREQRGEATTEKSSTESHAEQLPPQKLRIARKVLHPKLEWEESRDAAGHKLQIEGIDKPVVGVKQARPAPAVALLLEDHGLDLSNKIESLEIKNLIGSKRGIVYSRELLKIDFVKGRDIITFDSARLLDGVKATANTAVLEAHVTVRDAPLRSATKAASQNVLHVYLQKLIVFLPGVCGSTISMTPETGGRPEEVFPVLSENLVGRQAIERLACKRDGTNVRDADEVDLFRSYGVGKASHIDVVPLFSQLFRIPLDTSLVYDVERRDAIVDPKDHAHLIVDGEGPIRYYLVQPWPYDWRGRLEKTVELLFDSRGDKVDSPYRTPPTLQRILEKKRKTNPLLDDKIALVGHSTGGLVMRGALLHAGVASLVDQAFFIDVPFFGAPKSYYVFLNGDMGVPIVAGSLMRNLAPNMPIVYYLAPNLGYPDPVVRDEFNKAAGMKGGSLLLTTLVSEAKAAGFYPKDRPADAGYNRDLQKSAWAYHEAVQREPAVGWDRCFVFYSNKAPAPNGTCSGGMTIGIVKVGKKGFECEPTAGDYTVPLVSQLGDFARHDETEKIAIPGSPQHVPAPSTDFVWEEIVKRIVR